MTKIKIAERRTFFEQWIKNSEERLNRWFAKLPEQLVEQLNFRSDSLDKVEIYMLDRFDHYMAAFSKDNSEEIDAMVTYIGEVFIRNLPNAYWYIHSDDFKEEIRNELHAAVMIEGFTMYKIFSEIPPILNLRTGKELSKLLQLIQRRILEIQNEKNNQVLSNEKISIEERGFAYQYMFLLTDPKYTLQQLQTWLEAYYQKMIAAQKASLELPLPSHLLLHLGNYRFHFIHKDEDWVKEESAEMADNYRGSAVSKEQIRQCASRIEFYGDEDPQMDYFNEQFSLLQQLKDEPGLLIFDYLNNQFIQEM